MRLATYTATSTKQARLGAAIDLAGQAYLLDLVGAYARLLATVEHRAPAAALAEAEARIPADMLSLIRSGEPSLVLLRKLLDSARSVLADTAVRKEWQSQGLVHTEATVRLLPPLLNPGKIIMVGANYRTHIGEAGEAASKLPPARSEKHDWPIAFAKFPSVLVGHTASVPYPSQTAQLDYEAELCVVIGRRCKNLKAAEALDAVAGYTIANDLSMRDIQFAEMRRGMILLGKNLDGSLPLGPYFVPKDALPDPQTLSIKCWVNGELRQSDNTANMIFSVADLVAYYSQMTLEPGDMISTGTPAGVGIFMKPPENGLLRIGDTMEIEIDGLGRLRNAVIAEKEWNHVA